MPKIKTSYNVILFALAVSIFVGCDRTYVADEGSSKPQDATAELPVSEKPQTSSVAPNKLTNATSPADAAELAKEDATPGGVCQKFMHLLKAEKRVEAENLLTPMALAVTTKAGLQLDPMGLPTSTYKVTDVRYATNKRKLAQVACSIEDKVDGEDYQMDVTWLVRKQSNGWRISGVMLEMEPGSEKDLLSFENIHDVTKIKALADSEVLNEDSREANASDTTLK